MIKKKFNEKIEEVAFWTFRFLFWYLVVAFFLKSNYPINEYKFNNSMAYDVLKDALTLAAAFLAPVAAFILFSDWRVQHKEVALEKNTQESYKNLNDCFKAILDFKYEVCKGEKLDEDRCLGVVATKDRVLHLIDIADRSLNLLDDQLDTSKFKTECKEIVGLLKSCLTKLYELDLEYQKSQLPYCPNFQFADGQINDINQRLHNLSIELENYKV